LEQRSPQSTFQARVFAAYEALHYALAARSAIRNETTGGALAGAFVVSDSLSGSSDALPLAAAIAGAAFLGLEENAEAAREMLRHGRCDFVVNTLDEALRILKNELRQKKPVSVVLAGSVEENLRQMAERGVAPDLLLHVRRVEDCVPLRAMAGFGALLLPAEQVADCLTRPANERGALAHWTLPNGTAVMLARLDSVVLPLLPADDRVRRRWMEAAQRFLPREAGAPTRVFSFTHIEQERFLDAVCARIMSGEVVAPVEVEIAGNRMVLGGECAT
jgi:urocanate hydratase